MRMSKTLSVSVIIPSKGGEYLEYTLKSLANQSIKPNEVILVLKNCDTKIFESLCERLKLNCVIEEQKEGYVTNAMNIGKKIANCEIIVFTDDDVVSPENWIRNYVKLFKKYPNKIGSLSSRDIYYNLKTKRTVKTPDDLLHVKLFRWIVRPIIDPPHPIVENYKFGSYISRNYKFVFGKGIPNRTCYSLPFRGVNMAFRRETIEDIWFLENPELKRGFRYEQHFGIQIKLKGYDSIYIPNNPVYHILRKSLSRPKKRGEKEQLKKEEEIVKTEIKKIINSRSISKLYEHES